MRIACESVADNELCPLNALVSILTAGRRMTSHMDMLRRSNIAYSVLESEVSSSVKIFLACVDHDGIASSKPGPMMDDNL
jgi:hypothetical protein